MIKNLPFGALEVRLACCDEKTSPIFLLGSHTLLLRSTISKAVPIMIYEITHECPRYQV